MEQVGFHCRIQFEPCILACGTLETSAYFFQILIMPPSTLHPFHLQSCGIGTSAAPYRGSARFGHSSFLLIALLLLSALPGATAASEELGMTDRARTETAPALELNKLITSHPTDKLFIVAAMSQLNSNVAERYKCFYNA